jgi:HAD superfamily hydrolase (TIGR01490 family)
MQRTIAFFDFDGTITRTDTMVAFIKFCKGNAAFYKSLAMLSPWLAGMKLGLVPNAVAKEKMLAHFFKGMPLQEFNALCKRFSEERLPALIRPDAMAAILQHQQEGHEVVVVSASAENWLAHWCDRTGIKYLGTRLMVDKNNRITGKLNGANCNGEEKVNRIILSYDPANYQNIYCYGDTKGDSMMLKLATHPFYRYFHQ